jgi:hypothetical protein
VIRVSRVWSPDEARTVEQVRIAREEEANPVETFVAESQDLFEDRAPGEPGIGQCHLAIPSFEIVHKLPEVTQPAAGFT